MNKRKLLLLALMLLLLSACSVVRGSGDVQSESRTASDFNWVSLSGQGELILTQGEQESLEIEAEDNILAVIETEVRDNTLHIGPKKNTTIRPTKTIRYYLNMKDITGLDVSGAGSIDAGNVAVDHLTIKVSGSGGVSIDSLTATTLAVDISGAGDVEAAGNVASQSIGISGSGMYRAADLESERVDAEVNGAGKAAVWVSQMLSVEINGDGRLDYYGSPAVSQNINGSGELNSLGGH